METLTTVDRYTRAGRSGKIIECPKPDCKHRQVVYHFAWSAVTCQGCLKTVSKQDFFVPELGEEEASEIRGAHERDNAIRERCSQLIKDLWLLEDKTLYFVAFKALYEQLVSTSGETE